MSNSISGSGKTPFRHEDHKKAKSNQPKEGEEGAKMKFVKEKLKHRVIDDYTPKAPINASRLIDANDYRPNVASLNIRPGPSELNLPSSEYSKKTKSNRPLPPKPDNLLHQDKIEEKVITNKPTVSKAPSKKLPMPHIGELKESAAFKRRQETTDQQDVNKK